MRKNRRRGEPSTFHQSIPSFTLNNYSLLSCWMFKCLTILLFPLSKLATPGWTELMKRLQYPFRLYKKEWIHLVDGIELHSKIKNEGNSQFLDGYIFAKPISLNQERGSLSKKDQSKSKLIYNTFKYGLKMKTKFFLLIVSLLSFTNFEYFSQCRLFRE